MFVFKVITTILVAIIMLIIAGTDFTQDLDYDAQIVNRVVFGAYAMAIIAIWG